MSATNHLAFYGKWLSTPFSRSCDQAPVLHASLQKFPKSAPGRNLSKYLTAPRAKINCTEYTLQMDGGSPSGLPPLPEQRIVVGCGTVSTDFLASVAAFPQPDEKIRSTDLKVQGGGNVGNALTGAARLGLCPRIISKVLCSGKQVQSLQTRILWTEQYNFVAFTLRYLSSIWHKSLRISAAYPECVATVYTSQSSSVYLLEPHQNVANDAPGKGILAELEADGIDTSYIVVSEAGNSPFTYVIVDTQKKTRTCIHSPGSPAMVPQDLPASTLSSALTGARIVYFDGRLPDTALIIAKEATRRQLPILVDAERKREGLDELLTMADYVVCSAKFPQAWTEAPSVASALLVMALRLPRLKFVIVTLGDSGCIMLERNIQGSSEGEQTDVNILLESLKQKVKGTDSTLPIAVSSEVRRLEAPGIGIVSGRLFVGTADDIPPSELIDTTGAGDAFIGAVLYALSASMPPEKMLPFAAQVAAAGCRALGARTGLPYHNDSRLIPYL